MLVKKRVAKLIFFDNVYVYGRSTGSITEETPFAPVSKKGKAREVVDRLLLQEMAKGGLPIIITRAADFYGPRATEKSAPGTLVF